MNDKKKLGKGLGALLSGGNSQTVASLLNPIQSGEDSSSKTLARESDLKNIPIDVIQRGKYQPRADMHEETLEELASSIKAQGVMQPIVIRPISSEKYEIIAGERRWRASQIAGLETIPAIIKSVGDEAAIAMSLIENIQRENLNPIEEAMALKRLQDEFELTQQEVANAVGKSRAAVTNLMRLMGLHADVQSMLIKGELEMGHARALLSLPEVAQTNTGRQVAKRGLSVRQTESLVRRMSEQSRPTSKKAIDPDIKNLEEKLSDTLGAKVLIQHTAKGKGRVVVKYNSLDELEGILSHIK
ncbi:MAG: ParB/RepB/Spo0J family partition protein [Gammaproteobacteria bacterium]|nr:ParB/RepB/Spo0J family partition protein [Gammaproteobacteria bacterium]